MSRTRKHALALHPACFTHDLWVGSKMSLVGSDVLKIEYVVKGAINKILLPTAASPDRKDELWQHTCFEAFFAIDDGYVEFNFSPSRSYAAYRFEAYRDGMQPALDLPAPDIYVEANSQNRLALDAWVDLRPLGGIISLNLSAVIEELDGTKSYWALAHAPGPPDFHNRDCFIATLPAPAGS